MKSRKVRFSLIFLLLTVLVIAAGLYHYRNEEKSLIVLKAGELESVAKLKINEISGWYKNEKKLTSIISQNINLIQSINEFEQQNSYDIISDIRTYLKSLEEQYEYDEVILTSKAGEFITSTSKGTFSLDSILQAKVFDCLKTRNQQSQDLFISENRNGNIFLAFISPIIDENGGIHGTISYLISAEKNLYPIIKSWPVVSNTYETALFKISGKSIVFLNNLQHRQNSALRLMLPDSSQNLPAAMAIRGKAGIVFGEDYRNVEVIAYVNSIPGTPWYLVSKIDRTELFTLLRERLIGISIVTILFLLLSATVFSFLYSSRGKKFYKDLYNKEKELWQEQQKFKVTVDSLGEGIIIADTSGRINYMNILAEKLTGWNLREARGREISDVYSVKNEATGEKENDILQKVLKHGIVKELSNHTLLISKSGSEIPVMDTGAPIYDTDNSVIGLVLTFQDETEKRNARRLLARSEKRLRTTLDNLMEGCQIISPDWKYIYLNKAAAAHGRKDVSELLDTTMMESYPGIENTEIFSILKDCFQTGKPRRIENEFIYPNGDKGWFELAVEPVPEGLFILSIDITKRINSQKALLESESKYRELVENLTDIVFSADVNGIFEYASPVVENILGYTPEELVGRWFGDFLQGESLKLAELKHENFLKGERVPFEISTHTKDGSVRWLRISRSPKIRNNTIVGIMGIMTDITESVKTREELKKAKEQAEEMNRIKSIFFANMSHELRTPFVGITGYAQLMLDEFTDPGHIQMAEGILNTSSRMIDTITKILVLSEFDLEESKVILRKINLREIIESIVKHFVPHAERKELTITSRVDFEPSDIESDERLLSEILKNLVSNAVIYTNQGFVEITAIIDTKNESGILTISVKDTGIGIPEFKQKLIWDEFRQVSEGSTRKFQGIGLGLAIVKKFTLLLNGRYSLDSEEGKGSVFTIELPVRRSKNTGEKVSGKLEDAKAVSSADNKDIEYRILLVEDDKYTRDIIYRALSGIFTIDTADNADMAHQLARQNLYHLILMDINLGQEVNGLELTKQLREIEGYQDIPFIAVTAYAGVNDERNFLSQGMDDYIAKPFILGELIDKVKKVIVKRYGK